MKNNLVAGEVGPANCAVLFAPDNQDRSCMSHQHPDLRSLMRGILLYLFVVRRKRDSIVRNTAPVVDMAFIFRKIYYS